MRKILSISIVTLFLLLCMSIRVEASSVTTWTELLNELANGTDTEVILNSDVTIADTQTLDLNGKTLKLSKSILIDGGNLTITGNGTIFTDSVSPLIKVNTGSSLVLENGTYASTKSAGTAIRITGSTSTNGHPETVVTIKKDAKVSANYGVVIAQNSGAAHGVEVNIYGTIEGITENNGYNKGSMAITTNGIIAKPTTEGADIAEINIYSSAKLTAAEGNSGNINDDDAPAIYAAGYAIWNIYGGYIEGSEALSIKGGEFYITGGELKATGTFNQDPEAFNNGSEATGSAISITENQKYAGNIVLEVSDAEVVSENGYAVFETITDKAAQPAINNLTISSGNYSGKEGAIKAETQQNFIEGGTFSSSIDSKYIVASSGIVGTGGANGAVSVGVKRTITVEETVGGTVEVPKEAIAGENITIVPIAQDGYRLKNLRVITVADSNVTVTNNTFVMPDLAVIVIPEFEEIPVEDEKDNTPKTGVIDYTTYICIAIATITLVGIAKTKKVSKHSK